MDYAPAQKIAWTSPRLETLPCTLADVALGAGPISEGDGRTTTSGMIG